MSSVKEVSSGIGAGGILRSGIIATIDLISTANGKAIGGLFERTDRSASDTYSKVLHDEGLEPLWETFFCSILTKAAKILTPKIPEQITMIPGKLLGAAWHWAITHERSTNFGQSKTSNGGNNKDSLFTSFYNAIVKGPSDFLLKLCGLRNGCSNFWWYGLSQLGIFSIGSIALKNQEENLPGVDIDPEGPFLSNMFKSIGYTVVEQATYVASQFIRYYINFEQEFNNEMQNGKRRLFDKVVAAKALANVINERFFPGHILSGIGASISTLSLGKKIPKTAAAAIGEFPFMLLNRILNCHKRRATKYEFEYVNYVENGKNYKLAVGYKRSDKGKRVENYRFSKSSLFKRFLDLSNRIFDPLKEKLCEIIGTIFNIKLEELKNSLDVSEDILNENKKMIQRKLKKEEIKLLSN